MNTITITELVRNSAKMVKSLEKGRALILFYRGRPIGKIVPAEKPKRVLTDSDIKEIESLLNKIKPKRLVPRSQRERIYRKRLEKEYGPRVSRHKYSNRYIGI